MQIKFIKPKFKGFELIPFLVIVFILIISAVTSYVVINQGTGGYKSRAAGGSGASPYATVCNSKDDNLKCLGNDVIKCTWHGTFSSGAKIKSCSSGEKCQAGVCGGPPMCNSRTTKNTCISLSQCAWVNNGCKDATATPNTPCAIGYSKVNNVCVKNGTTPVGPPTPNSCTGKTNGYKFCTGNTVSECTNNGGKTSLVARSLSTCPTGCANGACTSSDPKPPANPPPNGGGGGGGGGGTASCGGGTKCDGTPVSGAHGETVCGLNNVEYTCSNGAWTGPFGACSCPSAPPVEVTPTVPTATTGDATLAFTLKLQGVTGNPRGSKTVPFKVKLKGSTDSTGKLNGSIKEYVAGTLTADSTGKWKGSVSFSGIALGANTGYSVYIKVGKHFQKRVCVTSPSESRDGTYSCSDNSIPLAAGVNNLDFSGILQLVGDLPVNSGEQNGVADSLDVSYILNRLRSTVTSELAIGDLNFDGIIDTQDRSLIIQSLNVKYDDE